MVSFNDGEDPHFRKAEFDPAQCPPDCSRPCQQICPAQAIAFSPHVPQSGVIRDRCYGCGRCLPICPLQHITAQAHISTPDEIAPLVLDLGVDAIEIHTQVGRQSEFQRVWRAIAPWADQLKLLAISCPDGAGLIDYLWALYETLAPLPCALVWQTDGRPMSGDIGTGTTRAAVRLSQKVLAAKLPGYVQLAGGTNAHTVTKLSALGLLNPARQAQTSAGSMSDQSAESAPSRFATPQAVTTGAHVAGIAYGSYARSRLLPILNQLESMTSQRHPALPQALTVSGTALASSGLPETASLPSRSLETVPELLWQAVDLAATLVAPLKFPLSLVPPICEPFS
jgi:Fe-S-cluster-containing hydrogenase component 2